MALLNIVSNPSCFSATIDINETLNNMTAAVLNFAGRKWAETLQFSWTEWFHHPGNNRHAFLIEKEGFNL
jgi:hypothetical protein